MQPRETQSDQQQHQYAERESQAVGRNGRYDCCGDYHPYQPASNGPPYFRKVDRVPFSVSKQNSEDKPGGQKRSWNESGTDKHQQRSPDKTKAETYGTLERGPEKDGDVRQYDVGPGQ